MAPPRKSPNSPRLSGVAPAAGVTVGLAACLVATLLCGCGAAPSAPSRAEQQTASLGQRAAKALEQGDLRRARSLYLEALRIDASVENAEGVAINRINLAAVFEASGETEAAQRMLDAAMAGTPMATAARRAEAAARKALLYLAAADLARAGEAALQAHELCKPDCAALAAILNLRGRVALGAGEALAALEWSARALAAAGGSDARTERANARRLAGEARLATGEHAAAVQSIEQALALDHALGLPEKIEMDLTLLARAHEAMGERAAATAYQARAQAVRGALTQSPQPPRRPAP